MALKPSQELLKSLFGHDFSSFTNEKAFRTAFFKKELSLQDLAAIHRFVDGSSADIAGKEIPSATQIGAGNDKPFLLLTQLHGNEPAGLAAVLYVMALDSARLLKKPVLAVIGNNLAAQQYFSDVSENPDAAQETRDAFRRGLGEQGELLADMNRIPSNFRELEASSAHYVKRWHELDHIANNVSGVLDIHTARGNMVCLTDSSDDSMLKNSPIRNIMVNLIQAIGSATDSSTFKTVASQKPNVKAQFGIEAGTHEDKNSFRIAAEFAAALFYNLGISAATTATTADNGLFHIYNVNKKLAFSALSNSAAISAGEIFYTAKPLSEVGSTKRIIRPNADGGYEIVEAADYNSELPAYALYQFEETEVINKGDIVAVSIPGGITLSAPSSFSGLFVTKSRELYSDESIGLYPVSDGKMDTKFCYPCDVVEKRVEFKNSITR